VALTNGNLLRIANLIHSHRYSLLIKHLNYISKPPPHKQMNVHMAGVLRFHRYIPHSPFRDEFYTQGEYPRRLPSFKIDNYIHKKNIIFLFSNENFKIFSVASIYIYYYWFLMIILIDIQCGEYLYSSL
jgi:hypothetical protein